MEEYKLFLNKTPGDGKFDRAHAILLTHDGRVLLRYKNGEPRITGGHIDLDDVSLEMALRRELLEEINCEIDRCDYLGYVKIKIDGGRTEENWARMVARVAKIGEPKADSDRENNWVYGRTLAPREIAMEELSKVEVFGKNNAKLLDAAYKVAREQEYFTELPSTEYEVLNFESHD